MDVLGLTQAHSEDAPERSDLAVFTFWSVPIQRSAETVWLPVPLRGTFPPLTASPIAVTVDPHRAPLTAHQRAQKGLIFSQFEWNISPVITVFLQTELRLSDLANLKISDVDVPSEDRVGSGEAQGGGTVTVKRRRKTTQRVILNYKACRALASWLQVRPKVRHDGLFVTRLRTPMSPRAIEYAVKKYLRKAGIEQASTHSLRHTSATHYLLQGVGLKTIQDLLGLKQQRSTERYLEAVEEVRRRELQKGAL